MITKNIFKVCLSCPTDMDRERQICEKAIEDFSQYIVADEIGYEVTHFKKVASQFGKSPQEIVNEDWAGFDLYIGLIRF